MVSYRASLTKIGIPLTAAVGNRGFASRPKSLRQAILFDGERARAANSWSQVSDIFRDDSWVDEVQGVTWDGAHWIFCSQRETGEPGEAKTRPSTCSREATRSPTTTGSTGSGSRTCRIRFPGRWKATITGGR